MPGHTLVTFIPSPLEHFGQIIGAPGRLHYTDEIIPQGRGRCLASGSGMHTAEASFDIGTTTFAAGSLIIKASEQGGNLTDQLESVAEELGLQIHGLDDVPDVSTHPVEVPRVGLIHTWVSTPQNAGWWRLAFDKIGIPYTYLSEQDLATVDLGAFDVLISIRQTRNLVARGSVVKADIVDAVSPITYGYTDTLAVYFSRAPVCQINKNVGGFQDPDWIKDEKWNTEVPRTVVSFAKNDVLLSGMMSGESELTGTPAVVDVPVGDGHVVLFANHPFWRWETRGSHAPVFNTMLHWNDLRSGWPEREEE